MRHPILLRWVFVCCIQRGPLTVRLRVAQRAVGSAALVLVDGATPLRPEPALFAAMLEGWRRQQLSRRLSGSLIEGRERIVRRFVSTAAEN